MTIEERAYYIWESNGRPEGTAEQDWNQALLETLVQARLQFDLDDPLIDKAVAINIMYPNASPAVIDTLMKVGKEHINQTDWD